MQVISCLLLLHVPVTLLLLHDTPAHVALFCICIACLLLLLLSIFPFVWALNIRTRLVFTALRFTGHVFFGHGMSALSEIYEGDIYNVSKDADRSRPLGGTVGL